MKKITRIITVTYVNALIYKDNEVHERFIGIPKIKESDIEKEIKKYLEPDAKFIDFEIIKTETDLYEMDLNTFCDLAVKREKKVEGKENE